MRFTTNCSPQVCTVPAEAVTRLAFSPLGTFLVTLQRVNKETNDKNLKV